MEKIRSVMGRNECQNWQCHLAPGWTGTSCCARSGCPSQQCECVQEGGAGETRLGRPRIGESNSSHCINRELKQVKAREDEKEKNENFFLIV